MLSKDDIVIEVGGGCGYAAAVASLIAREVFSYEIVKPLGEEAKARLEWLNWDTKICISSAEMDLNLIFRQS